MVKIGNVTQMKQNCNINVTLTQTKDETIDSSGFQSLGCNLPLLTFYV